MSQNVGRSLLTSLLVEDSEDEDLNSHLAMHPALIDQNSNGASNLSENVNINEEADENAILITSIVESANNNSDVVVLNGQSDHSVSPQAQFRPQQQNVAASINTNNDIIEVNHHDTSDRAEEEDEDDEYEFKSKLPRFNSNLDIKNTASKDSKAEKEESGGDEELCSICFEPWTNSGIHRLVCLKCGHLFGEGCIDRWVKSNPKCPQCNRPSKRTDIRRIYAKSIKVIDTAELDKAIKDLEFEKQERKKAEIHASEMKLQYQLVFEELNITKKRYKELLERSLQMANQDSSAMCSSALSNITNRTDTKGNMNMSFNLEKMMNLTETGSGCRCIGFSSRNLAILASQPSNNPIFPGYGIKKINILDFKLSQYIPIHSKMIRDIALSSQPDETLLTGGLDKMLKLTNLATNRLVHSYECSQPIWSCAYNTDNPIYFYAGLANGHILLFDKRKIDSYVKILNDESTMGSPVCSLQYVPRDTQSSTRRHFGLLASQLDKISFYQNEEEEHKYNPLLIESNIMSMSYHNSGHVLVSTRPTQKHPLVRHLVFEFSCQNNNEFSTLSLIQTFNGANVQKMLARSKLFYMDSKLFGISPCEQTKTALIWDVTACETMAKLPNTSEIIDVCPIRYNDSNLMCTLTDKQLRIFRRINN